MGKLSRSEIPITHRAATTAEWGPYDPTMATSMKTSLKIDFASFHLACVQTSPLPQKRIGRRDDVSSPDFFLREGGRLYTGYLSLFSDYSKGPSYLKEGNLV